MCPPTHPVALKKLTLKKKLSKNAMVALKQAEVVLMSPHKLNDLHQKKNSN